MARVNKGSHSFTCHPDVYRQMEWTIPAFTPQPQSITALWLVLISRPAEGRRLSWRVLVIWQQATLLPHMDGSVVFARSCQCAPHLIYASLCPYQCKSQTTSWSVQPFLHSLRQRVAILYDVSPFPPQNCLFPWGIWTPSNTWFLWSIWAIPEMASRLVQLFLHSSPQSVPILYSGSLPPKKNCPFPWTTLLDR